jgi:hypothetical protein
LQFQFRNARADLQQQGLRIGQAALQRLPFKLRM